MSTSAARHSSFVDVCTATMGSTPVLRIAELRGWTAAQVAFRFALDVGMLPLTGTTDPPTWPQI